MKWTVYKVTFKMRGSLLYEPMYFTSLKWAKKQSIKYMRTHSKNTIVYGNSTHYRWTSIGTYPTSYSVSVWKLTGNQAKAALRKAYNKMVPFMGRMQAGWLREFRK